MKVGNYNYDKDCEATFSVVMVIATGPGGVTGTVAQIVLRDVIPIARLAAPLQRGYSGWRCTVDAYWRNGHQYIVATIFA
jgi:hypothetical protein